MDCVEVIQLTETDSGLGGGGQVLSNQCEVDVEVAWCNLPKCGGIYGSSWTIRRGNSWPVSVEGALQYSACRGANTLHIEDSTTMEFTCSKPTE